MKIIPIAGYSGTGKTTFISSLISRLGEMGRVGVVKHLGHHRYSLEEGKDTTVYFAKGADISVGVDDEKTVTVSRENRLSDVLDMLANQGMDFAVLEGFKSLGYPKIVLGEFEDERCILRNPTVEEVIESLGKFADHYTMNGVVKELRRECDLSRAGVIMTINGIVREWTGDTKTEYLDFEDDIDRKILEIKRRMEEIDGILGVRFYHRKGRLYSGEGITYIAIAAEHRGEAFLAASQALDELKKGLHSNLPGSTSR
ncbi:molybdopterin-guanine dinucleotide biosynthesis protein B [Methanothrix sp.]|uniref:molybdopterin-guanine dinucleotide biosynthesis protein B n=1 Tax=Methanothrix sp. TaxID=90426 RepID=UPI0034E2BC17